MKFTRRELEDLEVATRLRAESCFDNALDIRLNIINKSEHRQAMRWKKLNEKVVMAIGEIALNKRLGKKK